MCCLYNFHLIRSVMRASWEGIDFLSSFEYVSNLVQGYPEARLALGAWLLAPCTRVLFKKLTVAQLANKLPIFTSTWQWTVFFLHAASWPFKYYPPVQVCEVQVVSRFSDQSFVCCFVFSLACCMTCHILALHMIWRCPPQPDRIFPRTSLALRFALCYMMALYRVA